jgi:hypothetical protein
VFRFYCLIIPSNFPISSFTIRSRPSWSPRKNQEKLNYQYSYEDLNAFPTQNVQFLSTPSRPNYLQVDTARPAYIGSSYSTPAYRGEEEKYSPQHRHSYSAGNFHSSRSPAPKRTSVPPDGYVYQVSRHYQ